MVFMEKTVFEKIIDGEIPCTKVYEDERFLAFLDINPVTKGHTLLIPKQKYTWIHDTPDAIVGDIFIKAKEIIIAMRKGIPCDYVQVFVEGEEVPHFHIHLIPAMHGIRIAKWQHVSYEEAEASSFAEKIRASL